MSKQIVETSELETAPVEVDDILTAVGGTLGRANNVLFLNPAAQMAQRKLYKEVAAEPLLKATATQKTISSNTAMLLAEETEDATRGALAKVIRDCKVAKIQHKEEADRLGAKQLTRIQELKDEAATDKQQLALDFASELIAGLIK